MVGVRLMIVRFIFLLALTGVVCLAQGLPIGSIQIYGNRKVSENEIRKVLAVREGGPLPRSKGDLEEKLAGINGVVEANLFASCCDDQNKSILYVGIEEKGGPHFDFNPEPTDDKVTLPAEIGLAYANFLKATAEAAKLGETGEMLADGHSLMVNAKVRYIQLGFIGMVEEHKAVVKSVLKDSADPEQRAIAAYLIGYAKEKASVQDDLQRALRDPDSTVRANALRALAAFVVYARTHTEEGLRVSSTWLIEMLNSIVWTDRNNAAVALVNLTEGRDESMLRQMRERALHSVVEMARWKYLPHALPAFILAGRMAGMPEEELRAAWNKEARDPVIQKALKPGKK